MTQAPAADVIKSDLFVPYRSTLEGEHGALLPIHVVRKRAAAPAGNLAADSRVILFIHGTSIPAPVAFDLEYEDYSWMEFLAREGFDVWAMSMVGYGWSATPFMDDPANVDPAMQHYLLGKGLDAPCEPRLHRAIATNRSEWDQIDTVVDFIRGATGAARLNLAVWSNGGPRGGGYASLHPDKVYRLFMHAPGKSEPTTLVSRVPDPVPLMTLQPRDQLLSDRWAANAPCPSQVDPAIIEIVWSELMKYDRAGANWVEGGVMRWPTRSPGGWPDDMVRALAVPTLVLCGEYDDPATRRATFELVGSRDKVWVEMECASHFIEWEAGRRALHRASAEWFRHGTFNGAGAGRFRINWSGSVAALGAGESPA